MVTTDPEGRPILWLGLTDENRKRLPMEPILLDLPSGLDLSGGRLVILGGRDDHSISCQLRTLGLLDSDDPLPTPGQKPQTVPPGRRL